MKMGAILVAVSMPLLATTPALAKKFATPRELKATAECVVEQDQKGVLAVLRTLPGSSGEDAAAEKLAKIYYACSGETMHLRISRWSQGLDNGRAELAAAAASSALETRRFDAANVGNVSVWYLSSIAGRTPGRDYDPKALGFQEFGNCVAKAAPRASAELLQSLIGSVEERRAIAAIRPVVGACVTQGQTLKIKADQIRLLVAEPVYHLVVDGPAAGRRS
jgi:hypothetical protein